MRKVKVSIVMLAYNHERFIEQALNSILMQQVDFAYEVIVGEDCSTDSTRSIIKRYEDEFGGRMKPIYREKNMGAARNMLDCLEHCQGEYIALLEGDDYWETSDKLAYQVHFLDEHKEYVACAHNWNIVNINGEKIEQGFSKDQDYIYGLEQLAKFELPGQVATWVVRNVYQEAKQKYDKLIKRYIWIPMDTSVIPVLLTYGNIYVSSRILSNYRYYIEKDGSNWSSKHNNEQKNDRFYFYALMVGMEKLCKQLRLSTSLTERRAKLFIENLRCRHWQHGKREKMVIYLSALGMLCVEPHKREMVKRVKVLRRVQDQ